DRLQLELGNIMASQVAQLVRDGLCHAFCYRRGQRPMLSLLCNDVSLCDEQESPRESFLHSGDQVWKVLGELIQRALCGLLLALILVPERVDDIGGRSFNASQCVEHVEYALTALKTRPCRLVVHRDVLPL